MTTANENPAAPLAEGKYSADQLRQMLDKGHAIKNDNGEPSYPIGDTADLDKAIKAVGRGGGSHDKIRAHIIKRAKALGASDKIPDNWSKSGANESATVSESTTLAEAVRGQLTGGRQRIKLIDAGWGSSGYYSHGVLAEAAKNGVFPAGTHMYLDHPSASEQVDRPERSVRDLAAVLTSPATFDGGALYAEARVFGPFQQLLAEQADAIGVSIRAAGTAEPGEAEGRQGMIITSLTEGISVDFVTRAGRGGQIVELLESARAELRESRSIGVWLESRIHLMFTQFADDMYGRGSLTRDERIALSSAIGDGLQSFTSAIEKNAPQLYDRDIWDEPDEPDADDEMSESRRPPVGAPPPGNHPLNERKHMSGTTGAPNGGATDLSEADRLRSENTDLKSQLAEAQLKAAQLGDNARELEETKKSLEESRRENLRLRANDAARTKAVEALTSSTLPETARPRVIAAVTGDHVPLNEAGSLDEAKLVEGIKAAIETERRYLARFAEEAGLGSVRGLGTSGDPNAMSEADLETGLTDVFTSIGLPSEQAKLAAKGR